MSGRSLAGRLRAAAAHRIAGTGSGPEPLPVGILELERQGPAPLEPGAPKEGPLSIATVIPPFRRGSGGHATIVHLAQALRERGHTVSLWLEDHGGAHAREDAATTRTNFAEFFAAPDIPLQTDFDDWHGVDVVLATGWQTVPRVLMLGGARGRAYLVQDHEPDFYGASAESLWAGRFYSEGLHCIAASAWLAELLRARYGASATHFDLGVEHSLYRPSGVPREPELVVFYARASTARRAVPLGLLGLAELSRRRPQAQIELYGGTGALSVPFPHTDRGVLRAAELAELYSRASLGVVLSLTNPSLVCLEMMACGLPCVELAGDSMLSTFGEDSPLTLAAPDPLALSGAIESLLEDPDKREHLGAQGIALMAGRTWANAAGQVEAGLRTALAAASAQV